MLQVFCFACETSLSSATLSSSIIIHVKPVVLFFAIKIVLYQLPHVVLNCLLFLDGFIFHISTSGSQHQVWLNGPQVLGFKAWSMCRKSQSLILPFKKNWSSTSSFKWGIWTQFWPWGWEFEQSNLQKFKYLGSCWERGWCWCTTLFTAKICFLILFPSCHTFPYKLPAVIWIWCQLGQENNF